MHLPVPAAVLAAAALSTLAPTAAAKDCNNPPTGLVPLPNLPPALYQGAKGGLYPGESNAIPAGHLAAGLAQAALVVPRDAAGNADCSGGRVGVVALGMSITRQVFEKWREDFSDGDPNRDPGVLLVNGTVGGQSSTEWAAGISTSNDDLWQIVHDRVAGVGLTPAQVQVAFVEMVGIHVDAFPVDAQKFQADLAAICTRLRTEFPNCRLAYLSSIHYLGYSTSPLPGRVEPYAYEDGFGVKWLIGDQIRGVPALNFDPGAGAVHVPWLSWGPYFWADGTTVPGALWECADLGDDVHLSEQGAAKAAVLMDAHFAQSTTTIPWYLAEASCLPAEVAIAVRYGSGCAGTNGTTPFVSTDQCPAPCAGFGPPSIPYLGNAGFRITLGLARPSSNALLGLSTLQDLTAPGVCSILIDALGLFTLHATTTNVNGGANLPFPIPLNPALQGQRFYGQWFVEDPAGTNLFGSGVPYSASEGMDFRAGAQ